MKPGQSIRSRAPQASSALVRRVMQANTGRTMQPERRLRSMLHRLGLRFRVDSRPEPYLRCAADLVFRQSRVCIFVDGCYWHGCSVHFTVPKQNAAWWAEKISDNRNRDARRTAELKALGWAVIRIWEHDLLGDTASMTAARIATAIRRRAERPLALPPARVRSRISSRSNSARAAKMPNTRRPPAVVVSICVPWPASTRRPTPRAASSCTVLTRWARLRPRRLSGKKHDIQFHGAPTWRTSRRGHRSVTWLTSF